MKFVRGKKVGPGASSRFKPMKGKEPVSKKSPTMKRKRKGKEVKEEFEEDEESVTHQPQELLEVNETEDGDGNNWKKKKKSGGFQSMGLSQPILKGIMKRGYKVPTPIQRKV